MGDTESKERKLRKSLRLYHYSAAKWKDCNCYFNLIFVIVALIQITKTTLITIQMMKFGDQRAQFQDLVDRGKITLRHLLLPNWESGMEVPPYPPAGGQYAVYTLDDLTKHINFAVEKYYSSQNDAVGIYMLDGSNNTDDRAVTFCVNYFTYDTIELGYGKHEPEMHDVCFKSKVNMNGGNYVYDIVADLKNNNMSASIAFNSFLKINLTFHLFSLRLDSLTRSGRCLKIQGIISFIDKDNNGQALVDLHADTEEVNCKSINVDLSNIKTIIDAHLAKAVMAFSIISLISMGSDLLAGCCLCYRTRKYMKKNSERHFPGQPNGINFKEYVCFMKGWNIPIIIGDVFTLAAKRDIYQTDETNWRLSKYDVNAIYLGVGCLLCWICLARYLHFNKKFHLLFKTMYLAIPDVVAYLFCVCLLFCGFTLCGYVVLGPYHNKFQTLSMSADTLFATISGDEITVTLDALETDKLGSSTVWWFAQAYTWLFVSIFTVFMLNILIAIFNSAYETIQKEYEQQKHNTDPLRRVLQELLHRNNTSNDSIGKVKSGLLEILNMEDSSGMSSTEYTLQQELKALRENNDTTRKPKINDFIESREKPLNECEKMCKVPCIFSVKDMVCCKSQTNSTPSNGNEPSTDAEV